MDAGIAKEESTRSEFDTFKQSLVNVQTKKKESESETTMNSMNFDLGIWGSKQEMKFRRKKWTNASLKVLLGMRQIQEF
ncbi:CLUMA_CG003951, isoform A [Clunio marinus]|uniref:CLUMA_CG003951, isoform A n=1 Tax=Clunio marinus TaxID=568069 RepID=A0A1J1HUQ6_9DIPT|nr:CLUMA_CG003951, isoform A [Clunio marinus]